MTGHDLEHDQDSQDILLNTSRTSWEKGKEKSYTESPTGINRPLEEKNLIQLAA